MSSKDRVSVTFAQHREILELIRRDAKLEERSESAIIVRAMRRHYAERKQEAELFSPTKLREAKRTEAPIFETPPPLPAERISKLRAALDQEKS